MKPLRFGTLASEEFAEAVRWYESRRAGLGADFYDAVVRAIERIRAQPEIGAPRTSRLPTREFRVTRFPYKIVYRVRDEDIYVVAIAHTRRRPGYWQHR